jgi:hypothetical protein
VTLHVTLLVLATSVEDPLALRCLKNPSAPKHVGIEQTMRVAAPIANLVAVIEDFVHYRDLLPDIAEVRKLPGSKDGDHFVLRWEQIVPIFFIPNIVYEMDYTVERTALRVVYRYKLKSGGLKGNEGYIALEEKNGETHYFEQDFIDAHWGPLSTERVWRESVRGIYLSDVAIKLLAENPTWSYAKIKAEAQRAYERIDPDACFKR